MEGREVHEAALSEMQFRLIRMIILTALGVLPFARFLPTIAKLQLECQPYA
jgi:hypothetical protein